MGEEEEGYDFLLHRCNSWTQYEEGGQCSKGRRPDGQVEKRLQKAPVSPGVGLFAFRGGSQWWKLSTKAFHSGSSVSAFHSGSSVSHPFWFCLGFSCSWLLRRPLLPRESTNQGDTLFVSINKAYERAAHSWIKKCDCFHGGTELFKAPLLFTSINPGYGKCA